VSWFRDGGLGVLGVIVGVLARGLLQVRDRVTRLEAHAGLDDQFTRDG